MKNRLIPFNWTPASWGLRGQAFDVAEAHYSLEGIDLDLRLAEINHEGATLLKVQADINYKYGIIDEYEWLRQHIMADSEGINQEVELLKLDIEFDKIEKRDGEKKIANLLHEPWVSIVEEGLDPNAGPSGFYFVFDWNEEWIALLRQHGYEGGTDDELMEKWFTDVCRNEVMNSQPVAFNSSVVYD
jgi:hypothetical protein